MELMTFCTDLITLLNKRNLYKAPRSAQLGRLIIGLAKPKYTMEMIAMETMYERIKLTTESEMKGE